MYVIDGKENNGGGGHGVGVRVGVGGADFLLYQKNRKHETKVNVFTHPLQITHSVLHQMHLKAMHLPQKGWKLVSYTLKYCTFQLQCAPSGAPSALAVFSTFRE